MPVNSSPGKLRPYAIWVIVLCMLLNMLDGYDVFIMGFALPHLEPGFATASMKGWLLSAALIGMGIGAVSGGRIADVIGRRRMLIGALVLNIVGLVISALTPSYAVLLGGRLLTGMAVGAISVVIVVLGQEVSPPARRSIAMGVVMVGFPLGSTVAGIVGATLLDAVGGSWRGIFWVGVVLGSAALILTVVFMPESPTFLRALGTAKAAERADLLEARTGVSSEQLAKPMTGEDLPADASLLNPALRSRTLLLWLGYVMISGAFYFAGTWTPQLVKDATGSPSAGTTAGLYVSAGLLVGAVIYALVGLRLPPIPFTVVASGAAAAAVIGFSVAGYGAIAMAMAFILGTCVYAAVNAYSATSTVLYPAAYRALGYGAMYGAGRVGAVAAPILAGYGLKVVSPQTLYLFAIVPLAISAVVGLGMLAITRRRQTVGIDAEAQAPAVDPT